MKMLCKYFFYIFSYVSSRIFSDIDHRIFFMSVVSLFFHTFSRLIFKKLGSTTSLDLPAPFTLRKCDQTFVFFSLFFFQFPDALNQGLDIAGTEPCRFGLYDISRSEGSRPPNPFKTLLFFSIFKRSQKFSFLEHTNSTFLSLRYFTFHMIR